MAINHNQEMLFKLFKVLRKHNLGAPIQYRQKELEYRKSQTDNIQDDSKILENE
jgi:hypothetical protein